MTSQVMALRRSGRLMVSVKTGPARTARRSPEAEGPFDEAAGVSVTGTPRRYPEGDNRAQQCR